MLKTISITSALLSGTVLGIFNRIEMPEEPTEMNFKQLTKSHGYPSMQYFTNSEDGYILSITRIPGSRGTDPVTALANSHQRPAVLFQPGLFSDSAITVFNGPDGPNKSLVYQLADEGKFDVWIMNMRGNRESRQHLWLDADSDAEFWNFTFEEMGSYDLKAVIEFIQKEKRSQEKVFLVSFSMGTTISFYGMATLPEYFQEKVEMATFIAPTIEFKHSTEPFMKEGSKMTAVTDLMVHFNYLEFNGPYTNGERDIFENLETLCTFSDNEFCDRVNDKM